MDERLKVIQEGKERVHLRGTAYSWLDEVYRPVDGIYEVSTISIFRGRTHTRETVAFKVSGVGPAQIEEPYRLKTLTTSQPEGRRFSITFRS